MELEILPNGKIRVSRNDKQSNDNLWLILQQIGVENLDELIEFFEESNKIQKIFGDEYLCG